MNAVSRSILLRVTQQDQLRQIIPIRRNGCICFIPVASSQQPETIEDICTHNCIIDSIAFGNVNITDAECRSCCKDCISNNQNNPTNCVTGCAIGGEGGSAEEEIRRCCQSDLSIIDKARCIDRALGLPNLDTSPMGAEITVDTFCT